jgi:tricorn protease
VENHGTAPDIEVDFDPAEWRKGRDPQLERAVQVALDELKRKPLPTYKKPAYPNYNNGNGPTPVVSGNGGGNGGNGGGAKSTRRQQR